ncbi:MAG TPA: hypothetical protein VLY46_13930 [Usitatibacter sp.]|nr:hypothetical protein [Usitatibacter sp.]
MKPAIRLLAACCCAFALVPAFAQGIGDYIDAASFPIDYAGSTLGIGGSSEQKLAQTLTVVAGGTLEGVFLPIGCGTSAGKGKLSIEIHDVAGGIPGPNVLAQRAVAPAQFDAPNFPFTFVPIAGGLILAPGEEIAIVVERTKGDDCAMHASPSGTDYPGGHAFFDARPNPPGWVPFSQFPGPDDLPFQLVLS